MLKNRLLTVAGLSYFVLSSASVTIISEAAATENIAKTDLLTAVTVALKHTPGSALEAETERKGGKQVYEIDIVHGDHITEADVDIISGKVTRSETDDMKHRIKKDFIRDKTLTALKNANITLPEAIAKVEKAMGTKAEEANFIHKDGQYVYEIETRDVKHKHGVARVDVTTGDLILYNKDIGFSGSAPSIR